MIRDLDLVGDVLGTATTAGATSVGNVQFSVQDTEEAYSQALALAIRSARWKANAIAAETDTTVTGIISIVENVGWTPPVVAREAMSAAQAADASGSGVPIQAGELSIRAEVQIVFAIR